LIESTTAVVATHVPARNDNRGGAHATGLPAFRQNLAGISIIPDRADPLL